MKELVSFKGSCDGLKLILSPNVKSFAEIKPKIIQKLKYTPDFFKPNTKLILDKCSLNPVEMLELYNLFAQYNLKLSIKMSIYKGSNKDLKSIRKVEEQPTAPLEIFKTIRGGEIITHPGDIIIYGNVNPSAKVIAGGSIDIHGICKGIVHAGIPSNENATVIADELSPSQIKIGEKIAISPEDLQKPQNIITEQAIVKDGRIIFNPYHR